MTQSGSDLMIPGVITILPSHSHALPLKEDTLVCVVPYRSTVPVAVGRMAISSNQIRDGEKGKAVFTIQTYKDALWERGSKADPPVTVERVGGVAIEEAEEDSEGAEEDRADDAPSSTIRADPSPSTSTSAPEPVVIELPAEGESMQRPKTSEQLILAHRSG